MNRSGVLLVGGGGFIGTALAHQLARAGREVHILTPNTGTGEHEGIVHHRGNQSDSLIVRELLTLCDTVVHLASATTPGVSAHSPSLDVARNLAPMSVFMEALSGTPPGRLIFISSGGAIYGNPGRLPADESLPLQPLSYHAAGKAAAETFLGVFAHHMRDLSLAILRPSNIYGPGQPLKSGFGIIRTLLEKAKTEEPFEIWGAGDQIRDFLYIDDLVDACTRLIEHQEITGTFNVGSGIGIPLRTLIGSIEKTTNRKITILERPARGIDVDAIYLDCQKLRNAIDWKPVITLDDGLRKTWDWLNQYCSS